MDVCALVIGDPVASRRAVMRALMESHVARFRFTEASTADEALEAFDPAGTTLVLVDWQILAAGCEIVRELRAACRYYVPVVMFSAGTAGHRAADLLAEAGADGYLGEPFSPEAISRNLGPLLARLTVRRPRPGFFWRLMARMN
jgi:DNA-binding response OmpR family regulator